MGWVQKGSCSTGGSSSHYRGRLVENFPQISSTCTACYTHSRSAPIPSYEGAPKLRNCSRSNDTHTEKVKFFGWQGTVLLSTLPFLYSLVVFYDRRDEVVGAGTRVPFPKHRSMASMSAARSVLTGSSASMVSRVSIGSAAPTQSNAPRTKRSHSLKRDSFAENGRHHS